MVRRRGNDKEDASFEYPCSQWEHPSNSSFHHRLHNTHERWGKNDSIFIMEHFRRKVDEIDVDAKLTDCFFFDGASNVQTAGAILCAWYPRAMCFHGGEHVLSLFFSDLSKINSIQVSSIFFVLFFWSLTDNFPVACSQVLQAV